MIARTSFFRSTACFAFAAPIVVLFACNAILGTSDYHVGEGSDAGDQPGQDTGGNGNAGTSSDTGGKSSGAGGSSNAGGKTTGSGGGSGTGGRGSGGKGSGGAPGAGGIAPPPGGAGGTGAITADDFIGEWDTDAETLMGTCDDGMTLNDTGTDTILWTAGTTANTIETMFLDVCPVVARISGRVATALPGDPCDDQGVTYDIVSETFTILSDGTAQLDQKVVLSSTVRTCTVTGTGIFTKYVPPL